MNQKNTFKKAAALLMAGACIALAGCGAAKQETAQELEARFENAVVEARGGRENCQTIFTSTSDYKALFGGNEEEIAASGLTEEEMQSAYENQQAILLEAVGLSAEDMQAYVLAISLINVRADAIAVIRPAEGKAEAVTEALNQYVANVQHSFEQYLQDQYAVAKEARIETLGDGTVVLVMCEDGDAVLQSIKDSLSQK